MSPMSPSPLTEEDLFESAPCGLLATDLSGRIQRSNRTLREFAGLGRDALLQGRRFQDLLTASAQIDYETHLAPLLRVPGSISELALELCGSTGERVPVLASAASRHGADGEPTGLSIAIFLARDRRRHEQELSQAGRQEHEIAVALQQSLLAGELPAAEDLAVNVAYAPGVQGLAVGGDWYDAFWLEGPGRRLGLAVGDVVGRGLAAAATMGQLRSATRAFASSTDGGGRVLEALDRYARRHRIGQMTTLVYCELDLDRRRLRYACAGHPPPLLLAPGRPAQLLWGGRSLPLDTGLGGPVDRPEATVELPPGSTVLLFTDGLSERRHQAQQDGMGRIEMLAGRLAGQPLPLLIGGLSSGMRDPGDPDDVCVLAARLA